MYLSSHWGKSSCPGVRDLKTHTPVVGLPASWGNQVLLQVVVDMNMKEWLRLSRPFSIDNSRIIPLWKSSCISSPRTATRSNTSGEGVKLEAITQTSTNHSILKAIIAWAIIMLATTILTVRVTIQVGASTNNRNSRTRPESLLKLSLTQNNNSEEDWRS